MPRPGEAEDMDARHQHPPARKNDAAVQRDHGTPADLPGTSPDVASWIRKAA
jgi:hypothetical protein